MRLPNGSPLSGVLPSPSVVVAVEEAAPARAPRPLRPLPVAAAAAEAAMESPRGILPLRTWVVLRSLTAVMSGLLRGGLRMMFLVSIM